MNIFAKALNAGVLPETPSRLERKIRITNLLAMMGTGVSLFYFATFTYFSLGAIAFVYLFFSVLFLTTIWLNSSGKYSMGALMFFVIASAVVFTAELFFQDVGAEIYILDAMILSAFIYEKRSHTFIGFFSIGLVYYAILFMQQYNVYPDIPQEWRDTFGSVFWFNAVLTIMVLFTLLLTFKTDMFAYEQQLDQANLSLKTKNDEISSQQQQLFKQSELLKTKNEELSNLYIDTKDSIRYARRIQTSLLLSKEQLREFLPDLFIYFKPKDIVSGDFYWFADTGKYQFLAVADCTGHGVPGAMMTIIGNNLLNLVINTNHHYDPALILNELDVNLDKILQQKSVDNSIIFDGMDIAIIRIDKQNNELVFASAKRPMYAFQPLVSSDLIDYKPSRSTIGSSQLTQKTFGNTTISYRKGDVFYLFTDGYADQLGAKGKFRSSRFKELLTSLYRKPMAEQHRILNETHLLWKVKEHQTDDMLVIGLKL